MKLILTHRHHQPSPPFTALVKERLESLREALQIDEARVSIERGLEASPAFLVSAHLVTPGPDVIAEAVDHTLEAAFAVSYFAREGDLIPETLGAIGFIDDIAVAHTVLLRHAGAFRTFSTMMKLARGRRSVRHGDLIAAGRVPISSQKTLND